MHVLYACLFALALSLSGASGSQKDTVLFMGSSSISGWRTLESDFPEFNVINMGAGESLISIASAAGGAVKLHSPRAVVLYAGENDINRGNSAREVCDTVSFLLDEIPNTRVVYITIKPSPSRWDRIGEQIQKANACVKDLAKSNERLKIADVFPKMLDSVGEPRLDLFEDDMLHMNGEGYKLWKSIIKPLL